MRPATATDADALWNIIHAVIRTGDTYAFDPATSREDMLAFWLDPSKHTYVAESGGQIVGTFFMKDNQPGLGNHIANAGYMTAPTARGQGIGKYMGQWSLQEARRLGYQAMQFNIVVKSNTRAVQLWQDLGFRIIGEIPEAFRHQTLGLTAAYIMYQKL